MLLAVATRREQWYPNDSNSSKIPCRVPFLGLYGPVIPLEFSSPAALNVPRSVLETPRRRRPPLSPAIRSHRAIRQPPNAFQVAIGQLKIHQVPRMVPAALAIEQKRFEKLVNGTTAPIVTRADCLLCRVAG